MVKFVDTDPSALVRFWPRHGKVLDPGSAAIVKREISGWIGEILEAASEVLGFRRP